MSAKRRAIVSSAHLVSDSAGALSEFEYGLIVAANAFNRWIVRGMAAAGMPDLGALDVLVLHSVNHRARKKKLADLCFVLNVEDTHTVTYALRKLTRLGLVAGNRQGKEIFYTARHEIVLEQGEQFTFQPNREHWFQAGQQGAVFYSFSTTVKDGADGFTDPAVVR